MSWFSRHRFKLKAEDFSLHIFQRSFQNFGLKLFSKKSLEFLFFLILFLAGKYLLKVCLKVQSQVWEHFRQLNESPLKMTKNAFYFTSKALFILKIFKFLSWLFSHVAKWLDKKDKFNIKFYDVTVWLTGNNCNTHIAQYLEK